MHTRSTVIQALLLSVLCLVGCEEEGADKSSPETPEKAAPEAPPPSEPPPPVVEAEAPMLQAVPFWKNGERAGQIDALGPDRHKYLVIDLGEAWVPYLFTHGPAEEGDDNSETGALKHAYREIYLQLAQERFPDNPHGERARHDKYLELYGVMPTFGILRDRMKWALELSCAKELDLTPLEALEGHVVPFRGQGTAHRIRSRYLVARKHVQSWMSKQGVETVEEIDTERLKPVQKGHLRYYKRHHTRFEAVKAMQQRLKCEGYLPERSPAKMGALDWPTHEALATFERRHRVYGWGYIGRETLKILQKDTAESEREAVLRVLTERAMHSYRAVEDGSFNDRDGNPPTFKGRDGEIHEVPNLEQELWVAIEEAFGLDDPESTLAWLEQLGELPLDGHKIVALPAPPRPEYHSDDMDLVVEIDRGDVWYEFPYNENGKQRPQPVGRRPRTKLYVNYLDQKIPLARFGTTIGGWRSEMKDETVYWKYKESPPGEVIWKNIVAAPVWLPPESTPPRDLLKRRRRRKRGEPKWEVSYHETGPSYASAYGLVAAYHKEFVKTADGEYRITRDDGIRSHGSVDYMSIMRRHSHGCHRLHNHLAVRLFAFVLGHRAHKRVGHYPVAFIRDFEYEEEDYHLEIRKGGYIFTLDTPIHVTVKKGRIRGSLKKPSDNYVPKYNRKWGAYILPDGGAVIPQPDGTLVPTERPPPPDGGVVDENGMLYGVRVNPAPVDGGVDAGAGDAGVPRVEETESETPQAAVPLGGAASPVNIPGL